MIFDTVMESRIRKVKKEDNHRIAEIIRIVMSEFGASGKGFAIHDSEVDNMYDAYNKSKCAYIVCELDGIIVGGGGIAPLAGGEENTCELKKMYFLPEARGKGLGQQVLSACLSAAKEMGFRHCYLETFNTMKTAMTVYEKNGFRKINGPLGNTGHFACDTFYLKNL